MYDDTLIYLKMRRDIDRKYWNVFKKELILTIALIFMGALFIAAKYGEGAFLPGLKMCALAGVAIYTPRAICLPRLAAFDKEKEFQKIKQGASLYNEKIFAREVLELEHEKTMLTQRKLGKILLGSEFEKIKKQRQPKNPSSR